MRFQIQIESFPSTRVYYDVSIGDDVISLGYRQHDMRDNKNADMSGVRTVPYSENMTINGLLAHILGDHYKEFYRLSFICDENISEEYFLHTPLYNSHLLGNISIYLED